MSLKNIFYEMAIRGGNFEMPAAKFAADHEEKWKKSDVIANLDDMDVRKSGDFYNLWSGDELVFFSKVTKKDDGHVVDDVYIAPKFRGKQIFSKMLLFFKTREHMNRLIFGDVHSDDTVSLLKSGGFKLFKKYWVNKQGEVKDFSPATVDDFYKTGNWKLVLENFDDSFDDYPRFSGGGYIKESYDILLNIFNSE